MEKKTLSLIILFGLSLIVLVYFHVELREYAYDDAYIHVRIAENLIDKGVPYYNAEDAINASSSPAWSIYLFILLMVNRLFNLQFELPAMIALHNAVVILAGAIIYTRLFGRLAGAGVSSWFSAALFLMYIAICLPSSIGLMETVTALLIVGSAFHLLHKNNKLSLTLFALGIFFRLEFVLVWALVVFYATYRKKFRIWDILIYSILGSLPLIFYEAYFFGSIIPNTIRAKAALYSLTWIESIALLLTRMLNYLFLLPFSERINENYLLYAILFPLSLLGLFVIRLWKAGRHGKISGEDEIVLVLFAWGTGILLAYIISATFIFPWYIPNFAVPLLVTCSYVIIKTRSRTEYRLFKILSLPMILISLIQIAQVGLAASWNPAYLLEFSEGARTRQYVQVGKELYSKYPQARLMSSEIGGLGYGFRGYILDGGGLASEDAVQYHPIKTPNRPGQGGLGGIPLQFAMLEKPELIVSYDIFIESLLTSEFIDDYHVYKQPLFLEDDQKRSVIGTLWGSAFRRTLWDVKYLYIMIRSDLPQLEE